MLRDYFKSLAFVAALLLGYTALVVTNKKPVEPRLETARTAVSIQTESMPTSSSIAPINGATDVND